jgi:galactonate dehydratase
MQVTKLECLVVHPGWRKNLIFVRIEIEDGTVGWGEVYSQYDRDQAIAAQVQNLGQYLIGRNVFEIKHFCQIAFDDYSQRRSSLEFWCAIFGIEQAMWDAVGRITRQPVYNLIGGPVRNQIRVYANGWSYKVSDPKEFAKKAKEVIALGFDAIKLDPLPRPWRT